MLTENWDELVDCFMASAPEYLESRPSDLKKTDGRFDGAAYYAYLLGRHIKKSERLSKIIVDVSRDGHSYDWEVIENNNGTPEKVSFKMVNSADVFQRPQKNSTGRLTKPGKIILKNTMNEEGFTEDYSYLVDEYDGLIVLQNQDIDDGRHAAAGMISTQNLLAKHNRNNGVVIKTTNHQVVASIDNVSWDRYYAWPDFFEIRHASKKHMAKMNALYAKSKNEHFERYLKGSQEILG